MSKAVPEEKFVAITEAGGKLHALDASGRVWRYVPESHEPKRFAFWSRLTDDRGRNDGKKKEVPK